MIETFDDLLKKIEILKKENKTLTGIAESKYWEISNLTIRNSILEATLKRVVEEFGTNSRTGAPYLNHRNFDDHENKLKALEDAYRQLSARFDLLQDAKLR
jgi:hypothetical protein